ncbi:MAG TPA: hypothetical protein VNC50_13970 [Planctomycetia bacterium]|nr:hypothetical protein [Planctomycetia bacterium]
MVEISVSRPSRLESAAACALAVVVGLACLTKPLHIDDVLYVRIAQHIARHPGDPYGGIINWQHIPTPAYKVSISPPLLNYCFAPFLALGGEPHVVLGAAMIPWLVLAAWALLHLGARVTPGGGALALFVLAGPAVVAGTNRMIDVPLLAAMTAALECAFRYSLGRSRWWLLPCGLLAAAAALLKYPGLALVPALLVAAIVWRKPLLVLPAILPCLATAWWQWWSQRLYGAGQIAEAGGFLARFHGVGFAVYAGRFMQAWALLAWTCPAWLLAFRRWRSPVLWGATLVGLSLAFLALPPYWKDSRAISLTTAASGALALGGWCSLAWEAFRRGPSPVAWPAAIWCVSVLGMTVLAAPFMAVRYYLPLHPWLVLVALPGASTFSRRLVLALTAFAGVAVGYSDWKWARINPELIAAVDAKHPGRPMYFGGHWGWQFYAEENGMTAWDARQTQLPAGVWLAVPLRADPTPIHPAVYAGARTVDELASANWPLGLATLWVSPKTQIGIRLYGGTYPHLPYGFAPGPIERVVILRNLGDP